MGKRDYTCRDCKECRKTGGAKLLRSGLKVGAFFATGGASIAFDAANVAAKKTVSDVCPICGHRMKLHEHR